MESKKPGNNHILDFREANDRIIANANTGPNLVIKTNLDPKDVSENNPYFSKVETKDAQALKEYFEES
jgi:ribosomal 30S subunit maturation factor RimM